MSDVAISTTMSALDKTGITLRPAMPGLRLQCPTCRKPMLSSESCPEGLCAACGFSISEVNGIIRALPWERQLYFREFIQQCESAAAKEAIGSSPEEYYLALPFKELRRRSRGQWHVRAKTFRHLEKRILAAIEKDHPRGCDILDLGAGNCWMSFRLAVRGHRPVAVDLADNESDGLGAGKHYLQHLSRWFPRFQAEMDRLPFSCSQFDAVIFNASFHYSLDYELTIREALRCLRDGGYLIIADSPFYWRGESGDAMLREKYEGFQRQFGFRSDSIPSSEYLTPAILDQLAYKFSLRWNISKPWYGISWELRPAKAWLLRKREPSKFFVIWAQVRK